MAEFLSHEHPIVKKESVFFHTFGCQMNIHDTTKMSSHLQNASYQISPFPETADVIILNTCAIREKAEQKMRSALGKYYLLKKKNPDLFIGVVGCLAKQEGEAIIKRAPYVDMVLGPDYIGDLASLIHEKRFYNKPLIRTQFKTKRAYEFPKNIETDPRKNISSFVSIMKGCDKFCTFCIVPFVRGREVSRPFEEIISEVHALAEKGTQEVVLVGQTVNTYGAHEGDCSFVELVKKVADVQGIKRIRFTSPHPSDFTDEQISMFQEIPKLCTHAHLPVQSGSNSILEKMKRGYTKEEYLEKISKLKKTNSNLAISTDIIVGFPSETDQDFADTLSLVKEVEFSSIFSFIYSKRKWTKAENIVDDTSDALKKERFTELLRTQKEILERLMRQCVGKESEILVESYRQNEEQPDVFRYEGRTSQNYVVHFEHHLPPEQMLGTFQNILISSALPHCFLGISRTFLKQNTIQNGQFASLSV